MFKHEDLQIFGLQLNKYLYFSPTWSGVSHLSVKWSISCCRYYKFYKQVMWEMSYSWFQLHIGNLKRQFRSHLCYKRRNYCYVSQVTTTGSGYISWYLDALRHRCQQWCLMPFLSAKVSVIIINGSTTPTPSSQVANDVTGCEQRCFVPTNTNKLKHRQLENKT